MIEGTTRTGFEFSYDEKKLRSIRVMEAVCEVEKSTGVKQFGAMCDLASALLGESQKEKLITHIEGLDSDNEVRDFDNDMTDIMNASGKEGKNS
ncbi:MAG: hypothetical protein LUD72_07810 [Bacteroidales bacterium]|nr:hypothetical protein [Bacteroidales bacterium]